MALASTVKLDEAHLLMPTQQHTHLLSATVGTASRLDLGVARRLWRYILRRGGTGGGTLVHALVSGGGY